MIREATNKDIPRLIELGREFLARSEYADVPINIQATFAAMGLFIASAQHALFVSERKGVITAYIMVLTERYFWADQVSGPKYVTDALFVSNYAGDGVRLLRRALQWAWSRPKVRDVTFGVSSGIDADRTGVLYERLGLRRIGGMYYSRRPVLQLEKAA